VRRRRRRRKRGEHGEGDGGMARSDTCGRKWSGGGFGHGYRRRLRRGGGRAVGAARLGPRRYRPTPLWHGRGVGAGMWRPRRNGALTGGPGTEGESLIGGTPQQRFFELKLLPNENSSKQIARS
jgi:hypothetical protein